MRPFQQCFIASLVTVGLLGVAPAQDTRPAKAPDNTTINKRDRSPAERTADQAKETTSDRALMQKIRKAIMADKSLSTYGHNVKVIAEHGMVVLKGPVRSAEESKNIESKAVDVAGPGNVTNQLSVMPPKTTKRTN